MTYMNRFLKRINIIMLAALLTANTAGAVMAAPEEQSEAASSDGSASEETASSSGTAGSSDGESDESVESSSEEEQYDYESAIAELEDLENQLDAAEKERDSVLDKIRALDSRRDRQLSTLNEDDQKKVVAMAAVTSGSQTLSDAQTRMDNVTASCEQALADKDKALDDLHTDGVTVAEIHAYRDAVRKTVKLKKQQTILQSELDTLTDEQQALEENLQNLKQGGSTETSADETLLEGRSERYLDLTEAQNTQIAQAVEAENKVASLRSETEAKAEEIRKALDEEQSRFDENQKDFDEEEEEYQEKLQVAENAVSGYSESSSAASGSPGTSSDAESGGTAGTGSGGDETVITRDNNGNVRVVTVHPDGTTSVADASADTSGIGETTTDGSISSGKNTENTEASSETGTVTGQQIVDYAVQFVGNPYVWGGTSLTDGCDCSGFVQSVFAHFGIKLSRTTYTQQHEGREISYADIQPGDVIYYSGHTAIYMGNNQIVHAANSRDGIKISDDPAYMTIVTIRRFY